MQVAKDLENKYVKYGPKAEQGTINQCHTHIHEPKERAPTHHQKYSDGPLSALSFSSRGKEMQPKQRRRDQRGRTGIKRNNQLRVVLFTHARKRYPDKSPVKQDKAAEHIIKTIPRKYNQITKGCCSTGRDT